MSLIVLTAPSPCADPDAIDLGTPAGAWLAPSPEILHALRTVRQYAARVYRNGGGEKVRAATWRDFAQRYRDELRRFAVSGDISSLLFRPRVVICSGDAEVTHPGNVRREDPSRSPRAVVAAVLVELGAEWRGELP